jgi:hypothetical protein
MQNIQQSPVVLSTAPLQTNDGPLSNCLHWDETCWRTELMSSSNDNNTDSGSNFENDHCIIWRDLGYQVDYSTADSFRQRGAGPIVYLCNNSCTGHRTLEDHSIWLVRPQRSIRFHGVIISAVRVVNKPSRTERRC